jgi:uncharacterized protein YcgI (DUF1989 family)
MTSEFTTLRARTGVATPVPAGSTITIVNLQGTQVVDTWALKASQPDIAMSMSHTRAMLGKLSPGVGDALWASDRSVLMTVVGDTTSTPHDTLMAACDPERYVMLGASGHHASCAENFADALRKARLQPRPVPDPLNLFMNVGWGSDGELAFLSPAGVPGVLVRLRAEDDVVVVMSACPQDLNPINGPIGPTDVAWRVGG